jgi:hypothetical protein
MKLCGLGIPPDYENTAIGQQCRGMVLSLNITCGLLWLERVRLLRISRLQGWPSAFVQAPEPLGSHLRL